MNKTKGESIQIMQQLGCLDWYANTHTCYRGHRPPCGTCPACQLRAAGFAEAGIEDPLLSFLS
jgi:7-cyano-7-deazaguanine synthase